MRLQAQGWLETSRARLQRRALIPRCSQYNANFQASWAATYLAWILTLDCSLLCMAGRKRLRPCSTAVSAVPLHRTGSLPSKVSVALTLGHQF